MYLSFIVSRLSLRWRSMALLSKPEQEFAWVPQRMSLIVGSASNIAPPRTNGKLKRSDHRSALRRRLAQRIPTLFIEPITEPRRRLAYPKRLQVVEPEQRVVSRGKIRASKRKRMMWNTFGEEPPAAERFFRAENFFVLCFRDTTARFTLSNWRCENSDESVLQKYFLTENQGMAGAANAIGTVGEKRAVFRGISFFLRQTPFKDSHFFNWTYFTFNRKKDINLIRYLNEAFSLFKRFPRVTLI